MTLILEKGETIIAQSDSFSFPPSSLALLRGFLPLDHWNGWMSDFRKPYLWASALSALSCLDKGRCP